MWIPLLILIFILSSQATQKQQAQRHAKRPHSPHRAPSSREATAPAPPTGTDGEGRADAFEAQIQQQCFMAAHAREEASLCDPIHGHTESHAPTSAHVPVQTSAPSGSAPVHPLAHLLNAENLQSAVLLTEILGPPGGKSRLPYRSHS